MSILPDEEFKFWSEQANARGYANSADYLRSILRELRQYKEYAVEEN